MPSESDHLALAAHNQETIDFLLTGGDRFPDWTVTVAFYTALHLVDAMLDRIEGIDGVDHQQRGLILRNNRRYANVLKHYNALKEASQIARYLSDRSGTRSFKTFSDYCRPDRAKPDFIDGRLRELRKSIDGLRKK
jgi:hypothetical protein